MIVRAPITMGTPPYSDLTGSHLSRVIAMPERAFRVRETHVLEIAADAIGATKCAGPRFRVDKIILPSNVGYRFSVGIVVDENPEEIPLARTFPVHGAKLSEMSVALDALGIYVKRCLDIYVRRYSIKPWYRFLGEPPRAYKDREQLSINTTRPAVKEPETVPFAGAIQILLAPPGGWN